MVLTKVPRSIPTEIVVQRSAWRFVDADSARLAELLCATSWDFIDGCSPDEAAESLCNPVLVCMDSCVPQRLVREVKRSRPWIDASVKPLFAARRAARGTAEGAELEENVEPQFRMPWLSTTRERGVR